jgi:hypothetical protein
MPRAFFSVLLLAAFAGACYLGLLALAYLADLVEPMVGW